MQNEIGGKRVLSVVLQRGSKLCPYVIIIVAIKQLHLYTYNCNTSDAGSSIFSVFIQYDSCSQ